MATFSRQLDDSLRLRVTFAAQGGVFFPLFFVFVKALTDFGTKIEHFNMQNKEMNALREKTT